MESSILLAKFWGLLLVITCLGTLTNQKFYRHVWQEFLKLPLLLILLAFLDLMVGLVTVLTHNFWAMDWRVVVTLLGWFFTIRGVLRILLPALVLKLASKILTHAYQPVANTVAVIFLFIGAYLISKGFF